MKNVATISDQTLAQLLLFFNSIHPLQTETISFLLPRITAVRIKKGKFLRSPIGSTDDLYFIQKGIVRGFLRDEGTEITTWLNDEGNIITSIRDLGTDIESVEYIQALEDTELLAIDKEVVEEWYATFNEANTWSRKIMEMYYRDADERAYISRLPSAEKRYKRFLSTRSSLIGRVQLKYLASYLGMKEETLCRVRAKLYSSNDKD